MSIKAIFCGFGLTIGISPIFGQDTSRPWLPADTATKARSDSAFSRMLKAAIVTRQAPIIKHQIDRIVIQTDQQINNSGTNVLEMIRQIPGVQVTPDGQITLNGRAGVNVLLDGKQSFLSTEDLANLLAGMPSSGIAQVELMTNPSAKYDAAGTGGIINIVRKRNKEEGWNGNLTGGIGQGTYPRYNGNMLLNYKTNRFNLFLGNSFNSAKTPLGGTATVDIRNGSSLLRQENSLNSRIQTNQGNNTSAGIDWYISKRSTLTLIGNLGVRRADELVTSSLDILDSAGKKTGGEVFTGLNMDHPVNYTTGFQLTHRLDTTGAELSASADYSLFKYRPAQYNSTTDRDAGGNPESQADVFLAQRRTLKIVGARLDYTRPWAGKGKIEAGLKSSYVQAVNNNSYFDQEGALDVIDSTQSDYNVNTETIDAAYINLNRPFKTFTIQAGLRAEETTMKGHQLYTAQTPVNQQYFQLFPTLFLDYKLDKTDNLNIQLGRRIDRADYHELVPFRRPLNATLYFEGNPYLKPSLTWHGEITWAYKNRLFLNVGYDIDKNFVRTLPYADANDSTLTRIPTNIQGSRSWTASLGYTRSITRWLTTNTSATFYQNSFTGNTGNFNLDDNGLVTLDFQTTNSLTFSSSLSGEVNFEYETRRQFVGSTYSRYSTLNLGLKEQLPGKKVVLSLIAHNIIPGELHTTSDHYLNFDQYAYSRIYTGYVTIVVAWRFGSGKMAQTQNKSGSQEEQQRAGN